MPAKRRHLPVSGESGILLHRKGKLSITKLMNIMYTLKQLYEYEHRWFLPIILFDIWVDFKKCLLFAGIAIKQKPSMNDV